MKTAAAISQDRPKEQKCLAFNIIIGTDSQYSMLMFSDAGRKARARGWKTSRNKPCANLDLLKMVLAWRDKYGYLFDFIHIYSHTSNTDPLSVGNAGADRAAVAGAKQAGHNIIDSGAPPTPST